MPSDLKVCHFTTVHNHYDVRIFFRECNSILKAGFEVDLIAPAEKDQNVHGINIISIPKYNSRLKRFFLGQFYLILKLRLKDYSLYHFHDPELLFIGVVLKLMGKKVVYDIHENVAEQIKTKEWLPLRKLFSLIYKAIEYFPIRSMNLILAENSYEQYYKRRAKHYRIVLNMPDLTFFKKFEIVDRSILNNGVFYIGGISENRGIYQVIKALSILKKQGVDFHFHCVGSFDGGVYEQIQSMREYHEISEMISFYGFMDLNSGFEISRKCKVGISVLKPIGNYVESYSTKIFEYMAVGLPVVTSNFKLYSDVIDRNNCGICVNALDVVQVADAIKTILTDRQLASRFGKNGLASVESQYSWSSQEKILIDFYSQILRTES